MLNRPLKLTLPTLLNLLRRRGGEPHQTLVSTPLWYDESAQRVVDQQVNAVLSAAGLMGPRGIDRDLQALIESLARPELEYYGWFEGTFPDAPPNYTVLAGSGAGGGFVLARLIAQGEVILMPERPENLLRAFINQIPAHPAPSGQPLVVTRSEFEGKREVAEEGDFSVMRRANRVSTVSPAKQMQQIMKSQRTGAGSLYVAARTRAGARRRSERPVNFIDAADGRWLMEERLGRGEPLVVFTPGTPQTIAERLRNAHSALG